MIHCFLKAHILEDIKMISFQLKNYTKINFYLQRKTLRHINCETTK